MTLINLSIRAFPAHLWRKVRREARERKLTVAAMLACIVNGWFFREDGSGENPYPEE